MNLRNMIIEAILYHLQEEDITIFKEVNEDWFGQVEDGVDNWDNLHSAYDKILAQLVKDIKALKGNK